MLAMTATMENTSRSESGIRWYAGFSVNNSTERALECLRNHYGPDRVRYPMVREMRKAPLRTMSKAQRKSPIATSMTVLRPLWTRYFLIQFSLLDGKWRDLFDLAHIQGLLCSEGGGKPMPAPIDDKEIEKLDGMMVNGAIPSHATVKRIAFVEVGEEVKICFGPFAGHNGTVDKVPDVTIEELDESDRLHLLVSMFGQRVPIELEIGDIEKL